MCQRGWSFVVKAATIILICNTVVQLMQTFTWQFTVVAEGAANTSILASVAKPFAYILLPVVGILSWQLAAAAVTGFIAKENVVGTLAVCFAVADAKDADFGITSVAALAYLMFNLFTPPCFAAIGAMNSEMKSAKWLWGGIGLQLSVGFSISYIVYTIGTLIVNPSDLKTMPAFCGLVAILLIAAIITLFCIKADKKVRTEFSQKKA